MSVQLFGASARSIRIGASALNLAIRHANARSRSAPGSPIPRLRFVNPIFWVDEQAPPAGTRKLRGPQAVQCGSDGAALQSLATVTGGLKAGKCGDKMRRDSGAESRGAESRGRKIGDGTLIPISDQCLPTRCNVQRDADTCCFGLLRKRQPELKPDRRTGSGAMCIHRRCSRTIEGIGGTSCGDRSCERVGSASIERRSQIAIAPRSTRITGTDTS